MSTISLGPVAPSSAFIGGAERRNLKPPDTSASLSPANTRVATPFEGVRATPEKRARPNEGSNIGIPVARLVQLQSGNALGAPPGPDNLMSKRTLTETEDLHPNTLAFILGARASAMVDGRYVAPKVITENDAPESYNGHAVGQRNRLMPGVSAPNQFQQLASLEYVQAYFYNVLSGKVINLNPSLTDVSGSLAPSDRASGAVAAVAAYMRAAVRDAIADGAPGNPGTLRNDTALGVVDLARNIGLANSDARNADENYQGIFARDFGPFLKGKGGATALMSVTAHHAPQSGNSNNPDSKIRNPTSISRNAGDDLCFSFLESLMAKEGLLDWSPDGLVLSKGVNDPSDKLSDEFLDARDGQLFNIRVQGPALGSSWSADRTMAVLPLDKTYCVLVADCWFDQKIPTIKTPTDRTAYQTLRKEALAKGLDVDAFRGKQFDAWTAKTPEQTRLVNFRICLATSSQMVNFSAFKPNDTAQVNGGDGGGKKRRLDGRSRMGLQLCNEFGEYIIGGWQIGNVLDTSASRGAMPQGSNIGVRTAPGSAALNINVSIGWQSADCLYRSFNNAGGVAIRPRYVPKSEEARDKVEAVDAACSGRSAFIAKALRLGNARLANATKATKAASGAFDKAPAEEKVAAAKVLESAKAVEETHKRYVKACNDAQKDLNAPL